VKRSERNRKRRVIVNRFESGAPGEVVAVWFPGQRAVRLTLKMTRVLAHALIDAGIEVQALWYDTWGREQSIDKRIKRGVER
jgi:hypothetical protein